MSHDMLANDTETTILRNCQKLLEIFDNWAVIRNDNLLLAHETHTDIESESTTSEYSAAPWKIDDGKISCSNWRCEQLRVKRNGWAVIPQHQHSFHIFNVQIIPKLRKSFLLSMCRHLNTYMTSKTILYRHDASSFCPQQRNWAEKKRWKKLQMVWNRFPRPNRSSTWCSSSTVPIYTVTIFLRLYILYISSLFCSIFSLFLPLAHLLIFFCCCFIAAIYCCFVSFFLIFLYVVSLMLRLQKWHLLNIHSECFGELWCSTAYCAQWDLFRIK